MEENNVTESNQNATDVNNMQQEQEVLKEQPKRDNVEYDDRHELVDPYSEQKDYRTAKKKDIENAVLMPTIGRKETLKLSDNISELPENFTKDNYTQEEKLSSILAIEGLGVSHVEDMLDERLNNNKDDFVNVLNYSDKKLNTRKLTFSDKGNMSQSAAVAKLRSLMSVGDLIQVPLWHSGFWVTITPPSLMDLTNLDFALSDAEISLGRNTATLIYSNYSVVTYRIVSEFLINRIHESTLELEESDDIRNHILLPDFALLVNALCAAMHPDGYHIVKSCRNTTILTEKNKPKCDFRLEAIVDPKKLIFVDRTSVSKSMLNLMAMRTPNSVTVDNVKEYQLSIKRLLDKTLHIKAENGTEFKVLLSMPTLLNHVNVGERWVNRIIKASEAVFTEADTDEMKNEKIRQMIATCQLGLLNSFIKSINDVIVEEEHILESLSLISTDESAYVGVRDGIKEFINNAVIAMVATPSYICPKCKAEHEEDNKGPFKEFIPLNIIEHFFALSALRRDKPRSLLV